MSGILLHICCAPCLIYPLRRLREKGFALQGIFYNPNICPGEEYEKRRQALQGFVAASRGADNPGLVVDYQPYRPADFLSAVDLVKRQKEKRCVICWRLRLKMTARKARERGISYFSTTLLVSPYQDHAVLAQVGREVSREEGVDFYYEDFRLGFRAAQSEARQKNIYRQKYCGCIYSYKK
ncbi:MAG: epoxyqueuosine reductase QueH [Candidatus Omnitrophota bacterium]